MTRQSRSPLTHLHPLLSKVSESARFCFPWSFLANKQVDKELQMTGDISLKHADRVTEFCSTWEDSLACGRVTALAMTHPFRQHQTSILYQLAGDSPRDIGLEEYNNVPQPDKTGSWQGQALPGNASNPPQPVDASASGLAEASGLDSTILPGQQQSMPLASAAL